MIYCWRNMIYGVRRMIYLRCKHDMISVPFIREAYIIRDSGYHSVSYIIRFRRERISLKKAPSQRLGAFFLVREMGLEPTRRNHTHLKRACLPFQHSRKCLIIIMQGRGFVNHLFCAEPGKIQENFVRKHLQMLDKKVKM